MRQTAAFQKFHPKVFQMSRDRIYEPHMGSQEIANSSVA